MSVKVKLLNRDGSLHREASIPEFYVRPEAVVTEDGEVFVTKASEDDREDLEYVRVTSTLAEA